MDTKKPASGLDTFDHVVVLMLENRSFDNLLGYLYTEDELEKLGKQFDGLQGKDIKMPVPKRTSGSDKKLFVTPHPAKDYHQPYPDPGEVYQHVNTQLYDHISEGNISTQACKMMPPYNIPHSQPSKPGLQGFVNDYINTLQAIKCDECKDGKTDKACKQCEKYHHPGADEYSVIMQCFEPEQVPVLTKLAREFAVFDNWFCSVPSQTWCNRAFWHASTSGGKVVNPTDACGIDKVPEMIEWMFDVWSKKTIFQRMQDKKLSHAVYPSDCFSLTTLVNGPLKNEHVKWTGENLKAFKDDIDSGSLPGYSFLEPKFLEQHNDQHPSSALPAIDDGPTRLGTVYLGELLIAEVYNTIFNSAYKDNTLLIITYDEHGGCFDHVPPPGPETVISPEPGEVGQKGFKFDRLGLRVPMVMVSAHIQKNTIVNDQFDHSSFIKTMCKKWGLEGLTPRDKNARSFEKVFSTEKRSFPAISVPCKPSAAEGSYDNDPLNDLQQSIVVSSYYVAREALKLLDPDFKLPALESIKTNRDAMDYLKSIKHLL